MAGEQRGVERWARSFWASGLPSEVDERVLREHPRAEQPGFSKSTPVAVAGIAVTLSGIVGVGSLLSSPDLTGWPRGFGAETSMMLASIAFVLSIVFVMVLAVDWLRRGRDRDGIGVIFLVLIPAVVSLFIVHGDNVLDPSSLAAVPIWITAGLSALLFVMMLVGSRPGSRKTREAEQQSSGPQHPVDIASLTPDEVAQLLELREQVIATLVKRERLAPEIAERAREMPLGELHILDDEAERLSKAD